MTDDLKHLDPSSIGEFRGDEIIASHRDVDIGLLRVKMGFGVQTVDPDAMEL